MTTDNPRLKPYLVSGRYGSSRILRKSELRVNTANYIQVELKTPIHWRMFCHSMTVHPPVVSPSSSLQSSSFYCAFIPWRQNSVRVSVFFIHLFNFFFFKFRQSEIAWLENAQVAELLPINTTTLYLIAKYYTSNGAATHTLKVYCCRMLLLFVTTPWDKEGRKSQTYGTEPGSVWVFNVIVYETCIARYLKKGGEFTGKLLLYPEGKCYKKSSFKEIWIFCVPFRACSWITMIFSCIPKYTNCVLEIRALCKPKQI